MRYLLTIVLISLIPFSGYGQERELLKHRGKQGYWFSLEVGDKMLNDLIVLPNLEKRNLQLSIKLEAKNEKISLLGDKINLKDLAIGNERSIGKHWKEAYTESDTLRLKENKLCSKKLNAKTPWYKKPVTVFFAGTFVGAALAVGIAFGINWAVNKEI